MKKGDLDFEQFIYSPRRLRLTSYSSRRKGRSIQAIKLTAANRCHTLIKKPYLFFWLFFWAGPNCATLVHRERRSPGIRTPDLLFRSAISNPLLLFPQSMCEQSEKTWTDSKDFSKVPQMWNSNLSLNWVSNCTKFQWVAKNLQALNCAY